ncbi:MAG: hypothetical protein COV74_02140 [Candidatus Omnitrophica bacterium CG11_big_fil_rev_8_21_14_0_20_45_26]|uniref:Uncharacterized protein n=1 Tax=Candidatus Abzuiibacterium crystallinum TaxID=1974748 RepID=A0A2H0LUD0_9BACT|nr:MAG: hypothetical protein COV74_02140 [Candidatus Omnitrophica bacterium CG11_big_fil_rev_8_21_14_0_20_45_26]PIW64881.1 MAG: hypothetical protein COW12_04380 [Candidatus Omnitrophica bacterium CG12_big_fil_rev_8_21_14_0_65_45_16]
MSRSNRSEQKEIGRRLKEMRAFAHQLDSIIEGAVHSQEKTGAILTENKLVLLTSQMFLSKCNSF